MKKIVLTYILVAICCVANAQIGDRQVQNLTHFDSKRLHFGFLVGLNVMDYRVQQSGAATSYNDYQPIYAEVVNYNPGINLGIVSSLRLNKYLNLRVLPGISFGQRNLEYYNEDKEPTGDILELKSTYIEMPIAIKYSSKRVNNYRPYLITGVTPRWDLAKTKNDGMDLTKLDLYYDIGVGVDTYLQYFRLSVEFKISIGLTDILIHDDTGDQYTMPYTQAIDKLTSNLFVLNFYFE